MVEQIGINYRGQENELRGCINDAKRVREFLISEIYLHNQLTQLLTLLRSWGLPPREHLDAN